MRLKGKIALITGGARGIGFETARHFIMEGAIVIIADINRDILSESVEVLARSGSAEGIVLDVTNFSEVHLAIDEIVKKYGRLDILFNNAGITADAQLLKMTEDQFDRVVSVNLKGVFNCAHAAAPYMVQQSYGKIINTSSVVAHNGNFGQTNYASTKAGVIAMTKTWARELARKGVNVNAVAPGYILTDMVKTVPDKVLEALSEKASMRRLGEPTEIAEVVVFLASDESSYINGAVICADGGMTL
jgi:Dehydrogenases with different specificities (related to short-chain alcohol dehydrogenases)